MSTHVPGRYCWRRWPTATHAATPRIRDSRSATGKLGDLAGFTSAIILAMIALLIGCEAVARIFCSGCPIHFTEAIPIACLGLAVNVASAWLLSGGTQHHHHGHAHTQGADAPQTITAAGGTLLLEIFEDAVPPRFRLRPAAMVLPLPSNPVIETRRPDGSRQRFTMIDRRTFLESVEAIPEPHQFIVEVRIDGEAHCIRSHLKNTNTLAPAPIATITCARR